MNPELDPEKLQKRYNILDLLIGIMIPAFIASVWPAQKPEDRVVIFLLGLIPAVGSSWWSSSLIQTFNIKSTLKRLAVHLGAFIGFVSFPIFMVASIAILFVFVDKLRPGAFETLGVMFATSVPSLAMIYVEALRQKKEKLSMKESPIALPLENAAPR